MNWDWTHIQAAVARVAAAQKAEESGPSAEWNERVNDPNELFCAYYGELDSEDNFGSNEACPPAGSPLELIAAWIPSAEDLVVERRPRQRNLIYLPSRVRTDAAAMEFCSDLSRITDRRIVLFLDRRKAAVFKQGELSLVAELTEASRG